MPLIALWGLNDWLNLQLIKHALDSTVEPDRMAVSDAKQPCPEQQCGNGSCSLDSSSLSVAG